MLYLPSKQGSGQRVGQGHVCPEPLESSSSTFGKGGQAPTTLTGHPGTPGMSWIHQKFRSVFPR